MKTVGEILKEERIKKGINLEEAESATKIRKKTLIALEEGNWGRIPATFIKGLIKNYAVYLGLDEKKVLAFFRREYDEKKTVGPKPFKNEKKRFYLTPTFVSVALISVSVIVVAFYLFSQYRSFTAPPKLDIAEPPDNLKTTSQEVNVFGQTWNDAEVRINGEKVQISPGGTFSVSVGLKNGINVIVITSENRFGSINTVKRTVVVETSEKEKKVLSQENKILKLDLEIKDKSTFVSVEVDGKKVFDGLMVAGSKTIFEAKESLKIKTSDAGNTLVTIGGEKIILGEKGESVEKEFTP